MRSFTAASLALGIALALIASAAPAVAQQVGDAPVAVEVLTPPTALFALGRAQFIYELRLTNYGAQAVKLVRLSVADSARTMVVIWEGDGLAQRLGRVGGAASATPQNLLEVLQLQSGRSVVAYLLVAMPPGKEIPLSIHHRLTIEANGNTEIVQTQFIRTDNRPLPQLQAPVAAGMWVAIRGPSNSSGHRLSYVVQQGAATIPQRFAVDWAMLGADGKLFRGDSTQLKNWYGYSTPVFAAAAGTVVWARDGMSENAPLAYVAPAVVQADSAVGNCVIIDLGGGRYATFAHLKPGSVRVKAGDRVTEGQQLAELGNSGNSLAPHLHFHVSSGAAPLAGEGLPFVLTAFELVGRVQSAASMLSGVPWLANAAQPARSVMNETPLENMVVQIKR